jgi:uncharacterized membrane protein
MTTPNLHQDQRMDQIMAILLRSGVLVAASLVFIGGVIYLSRHDLPAINYRVFQGEPQELRTVGGILRKAAKFHGRGLIQLGLLVLIATPVARVLFSVFAFIYEKDWTYVTITMIVLALLCYSLFGGGGL